jgi:flagellar hook-associated protein 3 FlgL
MSIASITRVSNLLQSNLLVQNIGSTQQQMLTVQNELATGKSVNVPGDNPSAAAAIQQLQQTQDQRTGWSDNVNTATAQLNQMDTALGTVGDLLQTAQSTASANASSTTSASARQAAATTIDGLYDQMMSQANTQFEGEYLFGGDEAGNAPYVQSTDGIAYSGTSQTLSNTFDNGTTVGFQVSGNSVFGGLSTPVGGTTNLNPAITGATRISDLGGAGGAGVQLGSIQISNGTTTDTIDLSRASDVADIANDINMAGLAGVTASIGQFGLKLTATGAANISVNEVAGGGTAGSLGILTPTGAGAGVTVNGSSMQPKLTAFTPLASLDGGAGITSGSFTITNGSTSKTISLAAMSTVGDLVSAINASGTNTRASISSNGSSLQVSNTVQGSAMTISEDGNNTATLLGIRSYSPSTALADLNGGTGVGLTVSAGATGTTDMGITTADGSEVDVDLSAATTVQNVLDTINTAAGGKVTASFSTTGNGIVITDNTTGSGALAVKNLNGSTAATDLGLAGVSAVGGSITGTDVNPVTTAGVFTDLKNLSNALKANNTAGITTAAEALQNDYNSVTTVRGDAGAVNKQLQDQSSQITEENTATQTLLSNLQDVDYTQAVTQLDTLQTSYEAALATSSYLLNMSLADYLT